MNLSSSKCLTVFWGIFQLQMRNAKHRKGTRIWKAQKGAGKEEYARKKLRKFCSTPSACHVWVSQHHTVQVRSKSPQKAEYKGYGMKYFYAV